jgi:hypothetical protein
MRPSHSSIGLSKEIASPAERIFRGIAQIFVFVARKLLGRRRIDRPAQYRHDTDDDRVIKYSHDFPCLKVSLAFRRIEKFHLIE